WAISGFKQIPMVVKKHDKGKTAFTLKRKFILFIDAITSFSGKPLLYIFYLGFWIMFFAAIAAFYVVGRVLFLGDLLAGWPSLIVSIWLLGGLTLFSIGIIGIYLSKIFNQAKQRPIAVVKSIYEKTPRNVA
ncbi:MAG: hypothetical protein R3206_04835, partial [Salegentibacter mishustinae]|nr:hypothetical protein [Salegentibacter mishustinae]